MNKDLSFLKEIPFFNGGIYDNKQIYENTATAIKNTIKAKCGIKTNIRTTQDGHLICYMDDNLMRLIHVEDKIKDCTFENIDYISKFPIMKLSELVELTTSIPIILELDKNNVDYRLKVMDILSMYEGKYAIVTDDLKTIKWINKNYPNVVVGYKIDKKNIHRFHLYKNYDFLYVDVTVYEDKLVRKVRENMIVLGYGVTSDEMYDNKKDVYDNLICESQFEKK